MDFKFNIRKQLTEYEKTLFREVGELCKPKLKEVSIIGEINKDDSKRVGIIGSRKMTEYGRRVVADICSRLSADDVTVVSGLMYGIDLEAHKQTLKNNGRTIAVLGYGFNHLYSNNYAREIANEIIHKKAGAIISEFNADQPPQNWTFPKRNRIVAALSDYLIIVEAGKNSGTLITADLALEMGKDVYAVPGSVYNPQSYGCNKLLSEGAINLYDFDKGQAQVKNLKNININDPLAKEIYEYIKRQPKDLPVDKVEVMKNTLASVNSIGAALTELELNNLVIVEGDIIRLN